MTRASVRLLGTPFRDATSSATPDPRSQACRKAAWADPNACPRRAGGRGCRWLSEPVVNESTVVAAGLDATRGLMRRCSDMDAWRVLGALSVPAFVACARLLSIEVVGYSPPADGAVADVVDVRPRAWRQLDPARSPSPRHSAPMAYDAQRNRIVLFGGLDGEPGNSPSGDTWEWDGQTWAQPPLETTPGPRHGSGLAYDAKRQTLVLVGSEGPAPELWEWGGGPSWTQRVATDGPLSTHSMAFASFSMGTVLLGGTGWWLPPRGNTWMWDGARWVDAKAQTLPPARVGSAVAFRFASQPACPLRRKWHGWTPGGHLAVRRK
jgi:hypothetical protein